ncbi:ribonuclease H-like domain-containing protein [Candidatus Woesearchaeota archaeon]|nr:ribonuclease H-like domain-containing protein [Candidatus Woesearchaeota archaeon]
MIRHSFIFLEKISRKKEENIWKQGIYDWDHFLKKRSNEINGISSEKKHYYDRKIKEAQQALLNNDSSYFIKKLPSVEMWRLYDYFREESGFLDIEVNSSGKIILVGISDYYHSNFFVQGVNLEKNLIEQELLKYKLIITFNGSSFDLPKLKKELGIEIIVPHLDLKPLCLNLGLHGGLKEVEKILNLKRPEHLNGNPVELWKAFHASGDKEYLDLLIDYNKEDIENLKGVVEWCYRKLYKDLNLIIGK